MTTIVIETRIAAPIALCCDLSRDVETHVRTTVGSRDRAIGGKTSGLLNLGDSVTWEAVQFLVRQRLTSKIVELDRPSKFVDEMVSGAFSSLRHVHEFSTDGKTTLMADTITWQSPLGFLGVIADKVAVERHMRTLVTGKQKNLKRYAEHIARGL